MRGFEGVKVRSEILNATGSTEGNEVNRGKVNRRIREIPRPNACSQVFGGVELPMSRGFAPGLAGDGIRAMT